MSNDGNDETSKDEGGSYTVGYGKPPVHGQIRPGEVRNPRGRPKGVRNLKTDFKEAMAAPLTVKVNGKQKRMSSQQAVVKSLVVAAVKGDLRSASKALDLSIRLLGDDGDPTAHRKLADEDAAILAAFFARKKDDDAPSSD